MHKGLFVAAVVPAIMLADAATAQKSTIRVASFTPERSIVVQHGFIPFVEAVTREVGDAVKLQGYWGGSLGRAPNKQFDLVRDGVADVAIIVPGFTPGRFPGHSVFELPFLIDSAVESAKAMMHMHRAGHLEGFGEVKVLAANATETNSIHTTAEIGSPDDLEGLKIRAGGPVLSDIVRGFGAVPIGLAITETPEALSRGVVEGVLTSFSGFVTFRLDAIAKYHFVAPLGSNPFTVVMNKRKFESLPARVRTAIEKAAESKLTIGTSAAFDRLGAEYRERLVKSGDHAFIEVSEAEREKWRKHFRPLYDEWIKENRNGRELFDTLVSTLADIRAGRI